MCLEALALVKNKPSVKPLIQGEVLRVLGDSLREEASVLHEPGSGSWLTGMYSALAWYEEAQLMFQKGRAQVALADIYQRLTALSLELGRDAEAGAYLQLALAASASAF